METQTIDAPTTPPTQAPDFAGLGVGGLTLTALARNGFEAPSPIQQQLIPPALAGRDCIGNAPTGTGKTAAFLVPLLEAVDDRDRRTQALVLVPTRELAHQVGREFERLSAGRRCRAVAVVGGESIVLQQRLLSRGCQIIVATPGRLIDLLERGSARLDGVRFVVLDEADQMLDIGFRPAVEQILSTVPESRQTLLLSATMPAGVRDLTRRFLRDPADVRLIPDDDATIPTIRQAYIMVEPGRKLDLIVKLLEREQPSRAIVFCRTKHGADRLGELLRKQGVGAEAMHGDLSQSRRNRVLHAFRTGRLHVLVATDVVGRGIDVPEISHVINFDLPEDPAHYVHRIGRTGRMGRDGAAFSLVLPDQAKLLDEIERAISRTLDADRVEGIFAPPRPVAERPRPRQGRRPGSRPFGRGGPGDSHRRRRAFAGRGA
ncbi:MAG TPA: DEAD/DEAH box helicase [Isosphaeraceae bacterium]|nr:DEAD/DEAH box helicase [Isosphaeraceae bacterium]